MYNTYTINKCISVHTGGQSGLHVLEHARETLSEPISASASACLGFYPVFKLVLEMQNIRTEACRQAIDCFFALCSVLDLLKLASTPGAVSPKRLHTAILEHLRKYQACYHEEGWVPKSHLALHLALMLRYFTMLLACFVHERKHKEIKRFGTLSRVASKNCTNTQWDQGVLENVVRVQLQDLDRGALPNVPVFSESFRPAPKRLVDRLRDFLGIRDANTPIEMSVEVVVRGYIHIHEHDVVTVQLDGVECVCEVWYHLKVDTTYKSCVSLWQRLPANNMFLVKDEPVLVDTACLQHPLYHRRVGSTVIVVPRAK